MKNYALTSLLPRFSQYNTKCYSQPANMNDNQAERFLQTAGSILKKDIAIVLSAAGLFLLKKAKAKFLSSCLGVIHSRIFIIFMFGTLLCAGFVAVKCYLPDFFLIFYICISGSFYYDIFTKRGKRSCPFSLLFSLIVKKYCKE